MLRDTCNYYIGCFTYIKFGLAVLKAFNLLIIVYKLLQVIVIDFLGLFLKINKRAIYILLIVNYFNKFA